MKRIFSTLLILCILFSILALSACGGEKVKAPETAYELFTAATEKTQALDSYEGIMTIKLGLDMMGITLSMPMDITIKAEGLKTEEPKVAMDMNMSVMGEEIDMEMYSDSEWVYITALGQSYKTPVAAAQNNYSDYVGDIMKELPETLWEGVEVTVDENGVHSFETSITSDTFKEVYADFIAEMASSAMGTAEGLENITVKDAKISVGVGEDLYFSKYALTFGLSLTVSGIETDMSITVDLKYVEPGKPVTVTFPEGYADFPIIDTGSEF